MFGKKEDNRTLEILLKIFLAVGIVAGICVIAKILYDKYKEKLQVISDEGFDCDFECLDIDGHDGNCDNCEFNHSNDGDDRASAKEAVDQAVENASEALEKATAE